MRPSAQSAGYPAPPKPSWDEVRDLGRVLEERIGGKPRWRLDFGWQNNKRIRIHADRSAVSGRPRSFESRAHAEMVLSEIRAAVIAGQPLQRILDRMRGRTPEEERVEDRLAAYVRDFERSVEQGKRSPNSLRELSRYARPDGHFSWWFGRSVHEITTPNVRDWHLWLGDRASPRSGERISVKSQKNVSDLFRTFVRRLVDDGLIAKAPKFPPLQVAEVQICTLDHESQKRVLQAIEWEKRGAFLAMATEALRPSEVRAADLDDFDAERGTLRVNKTVQGPRLDSRVAHTKNRTDRTREIWSQELREWLAWRLAQATPERRLRGENALFFSPTARNKGKRWSMSSLEREWDRACERAGIPKIPLQQGTRHSVLTALGSVLPERVLRDFSRHRDARSLDRYSKPRATRAAIVRALPVAAAAGSGPSVVPGVDPAADEPRPPAQEPA